MLLRSLTPPLTGTADYGLGVFFYLPHVSFIAAYGLDADGNGGRDPFVERRTTLGSWTTLENAFPSTAGTASYTDPSGPIGEAFYRIDLNP